MAYQGALGLDPGQILAWNESFAPRPDLVFVLHLPVPLAVQRLAAKGTAARQVSESAPYLARVAAIYDSFLGPPFRRLDASRAPEALHELLLREVLDLAKIFD